MKMLAIIMTMGLLLPYAQAETNRELTSAEISALEFFLDCPVEMAKAMEDGSEPRSGKYWDSRTGNRGMSFVFWQRTGFTQWKATAVVSVTHERQDRPAPGSRGYTIKCAMQAAE